MSTRASVCEEAEMSADYVVGAIVSLLLTGYLVFALLKPEKF
jgi:K+-transporting ATPase KdpF subunit